MTERRGVARHPVIVPVLCVRGDGSEFHAVSVDISAAGLAMRSATLPHAEKRLTCHIRGVGPIEARVAWVGMCDFAVRVVGTNPTPGEVARRLLDPARAQTRPPDLVRVARRVVPARTDITVTLEDGKGLPATILNLSASGVALRLDARLAVGTAITVGRHRATVTRYLDDGIGAAFDTPLDEHTVGEGAEL